MLADLRSALRALRRAPGFTLVAALTLALGVASTTAIFSVVDAVLLRPLPLVAPERVVELVPQVAGDERGGSPALLAAWADGSRRLAAIAGVRGRDATLVGEGGAERLAGVAVSGRFFDVLGLRPALGRAITPADDAPGAPGVVVLGEALWRRAFGRRADVVGTVVRLDGAPYTVVGVMPAAYDAVPSAGAFLVPLRLDPSQRTNFTPYLTLVARLTPGAAAADAARELDALTARLGAAARVDGRVQAVRVAPLDVRLTAAYRRPLLLLLGAVALVLLIACANVSTLVLVRATARARELGVRVALGAGAGRLLRERAAEHAALGALAAAAALPLAALGVRALVALAPPGVPRLAGAALDARAAAVGCALGLAASLASGVLPALGLRRPEVRDLLGGRGRGTTDRAGERARRALVAAQVALALALMGGAGLLLRSAAALARVAPGYDVAHVLTARLAFPERDYPALPAAVRQYEAVAEAARRAPGVVAAGLVSRVPLGGSGTSVDVARADRPLVGPSRVNAALRITGAGYFGAMGIPLLAGRDLRASDVAGAGDVVVVNASLARRLVDAGASPARAVGQVLRSDNGAFADAAGRPRPLLVVGVVGDVRDGGARSEPAPEMYAPLGQVGAEPWNYWIGREMVLVARTAGEPAAAEGALRRAVSGVDPRVPLYDVRTTGARLREALAVERFSTWLLTALGAAGLALVALGVHAVVAYGVARRAREVAVRVALGASPGAAVRLVAAQGMRPVAAGLAAGAVLAAGVGRGAGTLLFGVTPLDPVSVGGAALVLAAAAAAACVGPALRVARVDPADALRAE